MENEMIYIVHTYYGDDPDGGDLHLARTMRELAMIFKSIENTSQQYRVYEIPDTGPMREIEAMKGEV